MADQMMMGEPTLNEGMGPESAQAMLQPDPEVRVIVMSRLETLTPQELQKLDSLIDGESARILLKILPELEDVIGMIAGQAQAQQPPPMGALAQV
tara:strand:+ start:386 stop:670 length:285 start_codon:yes stop_codon:yes gene_type:complete